MSQWYLGKDDKVVGPVEKEEIISMIKNQKLSHLDLIYKDQESGWQALSQISDFAPYFDQGEGFSMTQDGLQEWVLLKKEKVTGGIAYKQVGPFSEKQILIMLDEGRLSFDDLIWKKDFNSWVPISQTQSFKKPLPSSPPVDSDLYKTEVERGNRGKNHRDSTKDPDFHDEETEPAEKKEDSLLDSLSKEEDFDELNSTTIPINRENFVTQFSRVNQPLKTIENSPQSNQSDESSSQSNQSADNPHSEEKVGEKDSSPGSSSKKTDGKSKPNSKKTNPVKAKKKDRRKQTPKTKKIFEKLKKWSGTVETWQWILGSFILFFLISFLYFLF